MRGRILKFTDSKATHFYATIASHMDIQESGAKEAQYVETAQREATKLGSAKRRRVSSVWWQTQGWSRECERQEREEMIMAIQEEEKVRVMGARQILQRNNEYVEQPRTIFNTHFD